MILKVNLLPYREARRLRRVQAIFAAWGATAVLGLGIIFLVEGAISNHIIAQNTTQEKNKVTIILLDKKLGEIKDINNRKREVETRLEIIQTLGHQRNLPVHLLEAISHAIPEKVWLKKITTSNMTLTIAGNTLSNAMVADFMRRLDLSPHISKVNLSKISQLNKAGRNGKLREFILSATIILPTPPKESINPTSHQKGGK